MAILRIVQHPGRAPGQYRVEISAEMPGLQPLSASVEFPFAMTSQEREEIRWYFEDFLEFDEEPAPAIAHGIEQRMAQRGEELFRSILQGTDEARQLWASLRPHLADTRIEIAADIAPATAIPWELMLDPKVGPLALRARALVRTQRGASAALAPAQAEGGKVRILLVICRPRGGEDVPFRSVASRLVKGLGASVRESFDLHVLRPPTYEQLARVLREAKDKGQPYHIVHFDGHGVYAEPTDLARVGKVLSSLRLDAAATGPNGYVVFEAPEEEHNAEFVDGPTLAGVLAETAVPLLVLNACQSAYAEAASQPQQAAIGDIRSELAAYGSLAQEVIDAGRAGVVAMRYSVYVVTAAQFVAELYAGLSQGRTLGEAVTGARKNLADNPKRQVAYDARPLQDWGVPVVYERAPLRLWPEQKASSALAITLEEKAAGGPGTLDRELPARPDVGFYGRDETLYALDRALDNNPIALLHAYAGSGKTATAAEFARWYAQTGGVDGPVLFSSFQRHLPLIRVLDKIGQVLEPRLERAGVHWDAVTDPGQRRTVALQTLSQVPVLWIWDNVEPVTGFPKGTPSEWSAEEQLELLDFLRAARDTKAKFVLTSRRDERDWLGELAVRVGVPPMPMRERLQLAGALAERHGKRLRALPDFRPLLRFTQGNPLSLLVTVGQALRDGMDTPEKLGEYVERLRRGEAVFEDEDAEGRSKSLGASLSYGFAHSFDEEEHKALALLHLFQGFVDVDALRGMGDSRAEWCLDAVRGLTRERGIALLDRAADIGLLTVHGSGYYSIHPALPWYCRSLFERFYPVGTGDAVRAARAFVEAIGSLSNYYHIEFERGRRAVVAALAAEEDNVLAAWRLARAQGWWDCVISCMQGLNRLYDETGRHAAWRRLVEVIVPEFVDPATDRPGPGREEEWSFVTGYRVQLAIEDRDWAAAERLQRVSIDWERRRAEAALAAPPKTWDDHARNVIRTLAVAIEGLAHIQRARGEAACVDGYREALDLWDRIADTDGAATCAFNLGHAHNIPALHDLDSAEQWYRRSLELRNPHDDEGRAKSKGQLGALSFIRFKDAQAAGRPDAELLQHLTAAAAFYHEALQVFPENAVNDLAVAHHQLGGIYAAAGKGDRALRHYRESIRYEEMQDNPYGAAQSRLQVALVLAQAGKFSQARTYAEAALANFRTFGDRAAQENQKAQALLAQIEQAMQPKGG